MLLRKLIVYHNNTEKFCIVNIHSINFSCPENVSSCCIKLKILSTKCLSESSRSDKAASCVEQDASSALDGTVEFTEAGLISLTGSGIILSS